jgi:hypothetical protein
VTDIRIFKNDTIIAVFLSKLRRLDTDSIATTALNCAWLYCVVLCYIVLYCVVLCCVVFCCTVLN